MNALAAALRTTLGWLVATALFLMMVLTFFDVVGRYVINRPLPGATELVQYMMVTSIFLALPVVTFRHEHISISLVDTMLGPRALRVQRTLVWLASAVVLGLLCVRLWMHGTMTATNRDVIGFLNLPIAPAAFLASVFCGATVVVLGAMMILEWVDRPSQSSTDHARGQRLAE
jgi:TRAP-type C4-dicarboxylate transport system permease small subunit